MPWELNQALGEMREVFGIYIAILDAIHGLDIEPGLLSTSLAFTVDHPARDQTCPSVRPMPNIGHRLPSAPDSIRPSCNLTDGGAR
ncbi:MAG: hypothetical protein AAGC76_13915 [Luteibacter sp.]|uniref:hypothetical protein n=1 Tax=Luteibacter sp. TaxID=1886636 RepID=UPI002807DB1A|nr:hypothetical protein [Luteibacter sp.]MDQ7996930.1 hypothetical protein [Luteibacter sp.]MDQ8049302.1 hypothetical protein [Luteibacter sp.]